MDLEKAVLLASLGIPVKVPIDPLVVGSLKSNGNIEVSLNKAVVACYDSIKNYSPRRSGFLAYNNAGILRQIMLLWHIGSIEMTVLGDMNLPMWMDATFFRNEGKPWHDFRLNYSINVMVEGSIDYNNIGNKHLRIKDDKEVRDVPYGKIGIVTTDANGDATISGFNMGTTKPAVLLTCELDPATDRCVAQIVSFGLTGSDYTGVTIKSSDAGGKDEPNVPVHYFIIRM